MSDILYENWEPVIGLEIHVQLATQTKLFTSSPNRFGDEPNRNIDQVDTGQPGTLPTLNKEAVKRAILFGLAIGAKVNLSSAFDRKFYFYPDSPRNFQITQFYHPILTGGAIVCDVGGITKHFKVHEAHLEDDSGMLKHFTGFAGVDYNRAGVALLEVVSEPVLHSAKEAAAYASSLKAIMQYTAAADCNMDQGGLRIDVNISVRPKGTTSFRPRVEIKNMNSFHNMEMAIESEVKRQIEAYSRAPHEKFEKIVVPGTYRFDLPTKKTILMRLKEEAEGYRYFPEPDLPPLILKQEEVDLMQALLPELPYERFKRYVETMGLSRDSAALLVNDKWLGDFFEKALPIAGQPISLSNWIIVEFGGRLKEKGISLKDSGLTVTSIGKLVKMIEEKVITGPIAKQVADQMVAHPEWESDLIVSNNPDYLPVQDSSIIEPIVDEVLKENGQSIADFKAGKSRAFSFLVGQVMKQTGGKALPELVKNLIEKKLGL